jgi:hypothetical protein
VPHYYPVVFPAGRSLAGDSLGFHAYSFRVDNCTNQWYLEESTVSYIPPYSLGMCLRLYGTGVAILLAQAPIGQPQLAPIAGEQVVGVYSDQLRTEVAASPIRNFSLIQTVSDFQQGPQPANPPNSTTRMWADPAGTLHRLLPNGQDATIVDSSNISSYVTSATLGGDLYGIVSNGHIGLRNGSYINAYDSGGTARAWATLFGDNTLLQLCAGGVSFRWANQANNVELMTLTNAGALSVDSGGLTVAGNTTLSASLGVSGNSVINGNETVNGVLAVVGSGSAINGNLVTCGGSGGNLLNMGAYYIGWGQTTPVILAWLSPNVASLSGSFVAPGGYIAAGNNVAFTGGDLSCNRGGGAGYCYFGGVSNYFGFDGSRFVMSSHLMMFQGSLYFNNTTAQFITCDGTYVHTSQSVVNHGNSYYFANNGGINITWNGTYYNFSHSIQFNTSGNQIVWSNGSYISGNAGYVQGSKRALKTAIAVFDDGELLEMVRDPRAPVSTYRWADQADAPRSIGFVADQLADVLPAYVERDADGEAAGYRPQELTAILWGAVRALESRVTALEGAA